MPFLDPELGDVGSAWTTRDPAAIQLVACTERDDDTESGRTCPFDGGPPTPLRFASCTVLVYETSTGVESGTTQIEANDKCPRSALVNEDNPVVFSPPGSPAVPRRPRWLREPALTRLEGAALQS